MRRFREHHLRHLRLHSDYIIQPERRARFALRCREPLRHCDKRNHHDSRRHLPAYRYTPHDNPASCSRWLHHHDVRLHPLCRFWHDCQERILAAQHDYRQHVAERWPRLYFGLQDVPDFPADNPDYLRRKLRRRRIPPRRCSKPRAPQRERRTNKIKPLSIIRKIYTKLPFPYNIFYFQNKKR